MAPNVYPLNYVIQSEEEARVDGTKICSKESDYSRETLEEIKNHYIKEEDASRQFICGNK